MATKIRQSLKFMHFLDIYEKNNNIAKLLTEF